jgi:hypothetical protein
VTCGGDCSGELDGTRRLGATPVLQFPRVDSYLERSAREWQFENGGP